MSIAYPAAAIALDLICPYALISSGQQEGFNPTRYVANIMASLGIMVQFMSVHKSVCFKCVGTTKSNRIQLDI